MCGIIGFNAGDRPLGDELNGVIRHRGPDDGGVFADAHATIGNRRLSIIDLSAAGRQPMQNDTQNLLIVYNGEVYNFRELRSDLETRGAHFKSETDTEVILRGYEAYGEEILRKLRGMWAFAIYDKQRKEIFLSRDPFGIKPLYYYFDGTHFVFASELKAIRVFLDKKKIAVRLSPFSAELYFVLGYVPHPRTPFEGIRKMAPGETIRFDLAARRIVSRQLSLDEERVPQREDGRRFEEVLLESVEAHLIADVPVGVFLSGGADSTLIALLLKKLGRRLTAFTVGIEGRTDMRFARAIAKFANLPHAEIELNERSFGEMYEKAWECLDEPIADTSLFPGLLVSREARRSVKVVVTGEGGDEMFWGYPRYGRLRGLARVRPPGFPMGIFDRFRHADRIGYLKYARPFLSRLEFLAARLCGDLLHGYLSVAAVDPGFFSRRATAAFLADQFTGRDAGIPNAFDERFYLPDDLLYRTDFVTMAYSLEGRVPFLDRKVRAFAMGLPASVKYAGGVGKKIAKEYLARSLPPHLIFRRKEGFSVPLERYLFRAYEGEIRDAIRFLLASRVSVYPERALMRLINDRFYFAFIRDRFPVVLFAMLSFYKVARKYVVQ